MKKPASSVILWKEHRASYSGIWLQIAPLSMDATGLCIRCRFIVRTTTMIQMKMRTQKRWLIMSTRQNPNTNLYLEAALRC